MEIELVLLPPKEETEVTEEEVIDTIALFIKKFFIEY